MFGIIDAIIVRPIVNILFMIYNLVGDFGLAVILFTVLVKLLFWPLMRSQLRQTRIMRDIQPELVKIKKSCNGNKQLESIQMMDLYKRKNIKPFRSMLTMFIQLPIFLSLFTAVNVVVAPRLNENNPKKDYTVVHSAYAYVENLPRIKEIIEHQDKYLEAKKSDPQASYEFKPQLFGVVDLSARAGFSSPSSLIILAFVLISAAAQFIMARQNDPTRQKGKKRRTMRDLMAEAADGKEPDQAELNAIAQSQMTFMMPLMMLMIMMPLPGAVVFYYLLSNMITIIQQKIIFSQNYADMEIRAEKKVLKELRDAKKAIIIKDETIAKDEAKIERLKAKEQSNQAHFASDNKNKNEKQHITRIVASNKKKRR